MKFRGLGELACGIFLCIFASSPFLFGQVGDPLDGQLRRYRLAEAWAPVAFQDTAAEFTDAETGFNPVDHLAGLFFDGNQDVRDNADNIFHLSVSETEKAKQVTPVYFSVIETETHYYINYIFYHAIDGGIEGHVHDTENLWTIIEKDGTAFGRLVMQLTNAHGFGMIYGPDRESELLWRMFMPKDSSRKFLPYLDRYSRDHNETGEAEYVDRDESQAFKIFIASRSHAIYKFSGEAWSETEGRNGIIYVPANCDECLEDAFQYQSPVRLYQLVSWDILLESSLVNAQMSSEGRADFLKVFTSADVEAKPVAAVYRPRILPGFLAPGLSEEKPKANLFYRASLKSPFDLGDPVLVHKYFSPEARPSQKYLFNIYVDDEYAKEMDPRLARFILPFKRASLFHIVSEFWDSKPQ